MLKHNHVTEFQVHQFTAFASDLSEVVPALRSGFPKQIETTMGNKQPFIATSKLVRDGDLLYVRYIQGNGCLTLKIFND